MGAALGPVDDDAAVLELLAAKESLRKDILRTPVTLARGLDPHYRMRPHLRVIGEAMAGLERGDYDRLLIVTPPQVGKSSSVAEWGPFWWLCKHPRDNAAITSYSDDLALRRGKAVKGYIEAHGHEYDLQLKPGSGAAHDYGLTAGGGVRSVSVGSGLTGFSVNLLTIDDPHKDRADAESARSRQRVHDWYSSTALKRLQPDRNAVVIIMTRWHCLTKNQRVTIKSGVALIQDIKAGDEVLTSQGFQQVLATASRLHSGPSVRMRFYGSPEELHVTPEHRLWTRNGWREARDVKHLDWVLIPARPPAADMNSEEITALLPPPPPPRRDVTKRAKGTGQRAPLTREQMQQHLDDGMTYQQIAERYGRKTRTAAYEWARHLGVVKPGGNTLRPDAMTDPDFWKVIGLWVAEGTITYGRSGRDHVCRWSFGEHERDTHAAFTQRVLQQHGLAASVNVRSERRGIGEGVLGNGTLGTAVVTVSSSQLAGLLAQFGRGARKKHLPEWAFRLPSDCALALVKGWSEGDGCVYRQTWTRVVSASERLLRDFQVLLARHGVAASMMKGGPGAGGPGGVSELRFSFTATNRHIKADEAGLWVRVKKIETLDYQGPVYDLQTPAGDFVAGGVLVHNCDDLAGRRLKEEGRLEDGGRWKVVHLPAIADPKFGPDPLGRAPGDPLTHPKIPTRDRAALLAWWDDMKRTSIVRDWHALGQGDPQPAEGALVSEELLRLLRDRGEHVTPQKVAVAVDPSGGGRDTAGVVGGFLGDDNRVWITHDRSGVMSSAEWSTAACRLAYETDASVVFVETNYGGDMCELAIQTSWETLQREGEIPGKQLPPMVKTVRAKVGKLLRAEPIAHQMVQDRIRLRGVFPDLEYEWSHWMPTDPHSPGRIDSSVYLVYGLLPDSGAGAVVHAPLPQRPTPTGGRAAKLYGRRLS